MVSIEEDLFHDIEDLDKAMVEAGFTPAHWTTIQIYVKAGRSLERLERSFGVSEKGRVDISDAPDDVIALLHKAGVPTGIYDACKSKVAPTCDLHQPPL